MLGCGTKEGVAAALALVLVALAGCRPGAAREPRSEDRAAGGCVEARANPEVTMREWTGGSDRATVEVSGDRCSRTYVLATTATLRDGEPENPRTIVERPGQPLVRTGNDLFDALYALAIEETRENSVAEIHDGAFNRGEALACPEGGCFETGRLWTYVWTRDTAYSVDLALGALDPRRARNSLELKLSERRGGGGLEIVQDTGSGGSYPISTDRVAWALGAEALLAYLEGEERAAFAQKAFAALENTTSRDRAVAFDPSDGLYRGETSFLDWREQSYPPWTAADTAPVGVSKALSTNVDHLVAIELAARLGRELGEEETAAELEARAAALRAAIGERFAVPGSDQLSSFIPGGFDPAPARRHDLLGTSLAVLRGAITGDAARAAIAATWWLPAGPPVLWPQSPEVPIYHNRAIWPFVTAYALRAAKKVRNDAAVDRGVRSLIRGAALNLSNMENFEVVTGKAWREDGELSGPVVNSQRQLWSVAGYLSMVHDVLFGLEVSPEGIRFQPYLTRALRNELFAGAETLALGGFPYLGKRIAVTIELPPAAPETPATGGAYRVASVRLDGVEVGDRFLRPSELGASSVVAVRLAESDEAASSVMLIDPADRKAVFGPATPAISAVEAASGGLRLRLSFTDPDRADAVLRVYRDGRRVGDDLPGSAGSFVDSTGSPGHCYTVEAAYRSSGNTSHRARPICFWGPKRSRARSLAASSLEPAAAAIEDGARWLREGQELSADFRAEAGGAHWFGAMAASGGPINTGITCAVIRLRVQDAATGAEVGGGYLMAPHTGDASRFLRTSRVRVELVAGARYRVRLDTRDRHATNMSSLAHFQAYTGGAGGHGGAENRARLRSIEVRWGPATPP